MTMKMKKDEITIKKSFLSFCHLRGETVSVIQYRLGIVVGRATEKRFTGNQLPLVYHWCYRRNTIVLPVVENETS